ncbi:MAG TPA: sensor histidine kinase [Gemmatimonas aurantiaca]|uniref:histidine kinase n=2 Tax=Gemmatimonas aurantiaca TaxID=173480 RepID=C1AAZ6_GEMAT|nr:ATP-binding protein [Gemmatimonas aurantiaca]BAH39402.1 phosphate regulon sensor protein PhoR [Gemmatimonas aurantiaca T-27]HCT56031.1 sensor histidine kinase [Gemmatimonas aurantiaca]
MKLTQRIVLNAFVVATVLMAIVLVTVERRVTERVRAEGPIAGATSAQSSDEMLAAIRRDIVIAGFAALLVGVVLAQVLARPVARPIEELRDVARGLAAGDLTQRPSHEIAGGEVGDLADALRLLAEQLDARLQLLHAEEALLVALTESLNEGVAAVDARQRVVRINETGRQLLRLKEPVPFPADYLPRERMLREALAAALAGTIAAPSEIRVDDRTLSLTARPLPDGGAVLALYDLTPVRRLEAVRRDFVANVSHELRTPLTVIGGFVETLQDEQLPPELRTQFLQMVDASVRRMQRIVDDLLDLSRIESGGWLPNPIELDVAVLAAEIIAPLERPAAAKGVALHVEIAPGAERVYADPTAARQILTNLAENALRHTPTGSVTLLASPAEGGVWIGVRDTGVGIGAEHLPRIFERFYRADPARSREAGGTGLGLSIVRHLTEAHGGRVRADSTLHVGTTIQAWLPKAESGTETEPVAGS